MKYKQLINQETLRSLPQQEQDNYLKVTQRKRAELALDSYPEYVNKPFYYHKSFTIEGGKIQKRRLSIKEQAHQDFDRTCPLICSGLGSGVGVFTPTHCRFCRGIRDCTHVSRGDNRTCSLSRSSTHFSKDGISTRSMSCTCM